MTSATAPIAICRGLVPSPIIALLYSTSTPPDQCAEVHLCITPQIFFRKYFPANPTLAGEQGPELIEHGAECREGARELRKGLCTRDRRHRQVDRVGNATARRSLACHRHHEITCRRWRYGRTR